MFGAIASALSNPIVGKIAGSVGGSILGNMMGRQDRGAVDYANQMSNAGYLAAQPYLNDLYKRGQGAVDAAINTGAYQGPTYAGMTQPSTDGYNNMIALGNRGFGDANNFMNLAGNFGQNYADLYNQASGDMLSNATAYATDPNNYQGLVDAATRDARRNLEENTLRGIDINASGSGNTNSSRAGVADAIAARGFADREADVTSSIQSDLIDRSLREQQNRLNNMTNANKDLAGLYGMGFDQGYDSSGMLTDAGSAFQNDQQNRMNDDRARFERNRDFELDQLAKYNAGILNRAPTSGSTYAPNMVNPTMAAISGGMFGSGVGGRISGAINDYFSQRRNPQPTYNVPVSSYY